MMRKSSPNVSLSKISAMPSLRLNRFSRLEVLASIRPELLRGFLEPYLSYFQGRGFDLGCLNESAGAETRRHLSDILMTPTSDVPPALVDALYCIHETAVEENTDLLERAVENEGAMLEPNSSLLEVALSLWMASPEALKGIHRRRLTTRRRSYVYFSAENASKGSFSLNNERVRQLEHSLAIYFKKQHRGHGCQIYHHTHDQEHSFLISHGELYRREATWEEGRPGTIAFRPRKYDAVVYNALTEELRINAGTETLREHYRRQFGFYLFGRENHFPSRSKYTLEPLLRDREASLFTGDIPEIQWARLSELSYAIEDSTPELRTHKASDVFIALERHRLDMPHRVRPVKATFRLTFVDQSKPRTLTIKPSNIALYSRGEDSPVIEDWLQRRGFIVRSKVTGHEQREHLLEID